MEIAFPIALLPMRLCLSQPMSDEELLWFCGKNDVLRIEREPNGELNVMSPSGSGTGNRNADVIFQLMRWAVDSANGVGFDSNAGFSLPDGSMRSPDASWVSSPRWNALTREQQRGFAPLCPEFVIELRSPTDRLSDLQAKMQMWLRNGAKLAWLIDPERQVVEVYCGGATDPEVLIGVDRVHGNGPVTGFILDLARIWT